MAGEAGLEPATSRLTAERFDLPIELLANVLQVSPEYEHGGNEK